MAMGRAPSRRKGCRQHRLSLPASTGDLPAMRAFSAWAGISQTAAPNSWPLGARYGFRSTRALIIENRGGAWPPCLRPNMGRGTGFLFFHGKAASLSTHSTGPLGIVGPDSLWNMPNMPNAPGVTPPPLPATKGQVGGGPRLSTDSQKAFIKLLTTCPPGRSTTA